jgi:hypothetical protein
MRLCILSDTHVPDGDIDLNERLVDDLKHADLIVHAGDFTSLEFYKKLKNINPNIKAVLGNMDAQGLAPILKQTEVFEIGKIKIGLMHGFGKPEFLLDNVKKTFDDSFDLIIYGHAHNAFNEKIGKTIYFNPGSPTDKIFSSSNSYGIIDIDAAIQAKIMRI